MPQGIFEKYFPWKFFKFRIKPLIVDFDCLENQNKGKDCTYPIAVAIPDGYPQMSNEFIEIKFTLDISENSLSNGAPYARPISDFASSATRNHRRNPGVCAR